MPQTKIWDSAGLARDFAGGLVVFLVALPLCLGIAQASNAPYISGLMAGIIGGIVVGILSGSHTSVAGPAAGLTAVVVAQIQGLGSFEAFLLALIVAGGVQFVLGLARAGFLAAFFPTSVIKGLLAAIGIIIILKQIPHVVGHDTDPEGEMAFQQPDQENTFSELGELLYDLNLGPAIIGLGSVVLLMVWDRSKRLKGSLVPAPLLVVMLGVGLNALFNRWGGAWQIQAEHLVQVPAADTAWQNFIQLRQYSPDFSQWRNPAIYSSGLIIALVASLETLLNLEAVDKLDPRQRTSPPSRELCAQGVGNLLAGFLGGIPVTSVIVRSSVNINAGSNSKMAAVLHGLFLLVCVVLLPAWLNMIPISCLAAILLVTGIKLASPALFKQMWSGGRYQFVPFLVTVTAIVMTDLLKGVLIGLAVAISFILNSNLRRPVRRFVEHHLGGDVLHIQLGNQVSFLNRASLVKVLDDVPRGGHVLLDAQETDYIDPDVLDLIRDFKTLHSPARGVSVSLLGFRPKYRLQDEIQYVDFSTRDMQSSLTPGQVLEILRQGNERFRTGHRLTRDLGRQVQATAGGQHPMAVVLSCIDSRAPAELILDLGLGDILSVRVAGNVICDEVIGSIEYGCAVAGAKLLLVLGHTSCGAVTAAVDFAEAGVNAGDKTGCQHLDQVLKQVQEVIDPALLARFRHATGEQRSDIVNAVAEANVVRTCERLLQRSSMLHELVANNRLAVVGALYDVNKGRIMFFRNLDSVPAPEGTLPVR